MRSRLPVFIAGDPAHQSQASFDQVSGACSIHWATGAVSPGRPNILQMPLSW